MESIAPDSSRESRNWLELPRDLTSMIFLKLGAVDILTSTQNVCSSWRKICKDPLMWRSINISNIGDWNLDYDLEKMVRNAVDRSCGELVDITVQNFGTDDLLEYITDRSSQLRRLRLVSCNISDEGLSEAAKKLPLLEDLDLSCCSFSKEALEAVGHCCPLLKSFKLNSPSRWSYIDCDDEALAIAESMPGLCHLQLFGNKLTNDGLHAILDGCPHLESLDLRCCTNVKLAGDLAKRCAEQIKILQHPDDPTDDYEFDIGTNMDDDDGSFDDDYPSGFSEIDFLSDDDYYEFSGGSDFSDAGEFCF